MCRTMDLLEEIAEIDETTEESLLKEINTLVYGKLQDIRRRRDIRAGYFFVIGQRVWFPDKKGNTVRGYITKINPKTIKVDVPAGVHDFMVHWTVAPSLCHAMGE